MSLGGGSNKQSQSQQTSGSSNQWTRSDASGQSQQFGTDLYGGQAPFLQDLFARANANVGNNSGNDQANQLMGQVQGYQDRASSTLDQSTGGYNTSTAALTQYLKPGVDPMVGAYAKNLGQQFNEQFLPGIKGDAALAGGLGGSRAQIGEALGAQRAMQTLGDFTAQTYSDQANRAVQAAMGIGQNAAGIGQNAAGYQTNADISAQRAAFAQSMPWYNINQYAGLLGSPIMQDKGGYSSNTSASSGYSNSNNMGYGSGSGGGWNANIGWNSQSQNA